MWGTIRTGPRTGARSPTSQTCTLSLPRRHCPLLKKGAQAASGEVFQSSQLCARGLPHCRLQRLVRGKHVRGSEGPGGRGTLTRAQQGLASVGSRDAPCRHREGMRNLVEAGRAGNGCSPDPEVGGCSRGGSLTGWGWSLSEDDCSSLHWVLGQRPDLAK